MSRSKPAALTRRASVSRDGWRAPASYALTTLWVTPARRPSSTCERPARRRASRSNDPGVTCTNYSVSSIGLTLLERTHLPPRHPRGCIERRVCHWPSKRRWRFVGRCLEPVAQGLLGLAERPFVLGARGASKRRP